MSQGGVAILIHEDMQRSIHQIARVDRRIMKVTLKTQKGDIQITIIVTYAPRKKYARETRHKHWTQVDQLIQTSLKRICAFGARAK